MKLAVCVVFSFFFYLADCIPFRANRNLSMKENFLPETMAIYTAEHEIVSIAVTLARALDDDVHNEFLNGGKTVFFALADIGSNGERIDKGLYVLKNRVVTKLLDNGRDTSVDSLTSKNVYFGASDGIYKYNDVENKAEKYGNITDSVIQIAKVKGNDTIYVLTEGRELYKVTEGGNAKTRVGGVTSPKEIALDNSKNLYYVGADNQPYVVTAGRSRMITGLSPDSNYTKLIRPLHIMESGLLVVSGDDLYLVTSHGTSSPTDFVMLPKPSAYAVDATLLHYYGYNKKIYEYNFVALIVETIIDGMKNYLQNLTPGI